MIMKSITAAALGSALLATTALAQTAAPTTTTTTTTSSMTTTSPSTFQGNWRTSKVIGLNVYNGAKESLGDINDLLTDKSGKIVAVVVGVGGFLGVGERNVAIPFEKVTFSNDPMVATSAANNSGSMSRPAPSTTTTGAAVGTTAPMGTTAVSTPNPWYPDHAMINATKDELKAMTEFKYDTK